MGSHKNREFTYFKGMLAADFPEIEGNEVSGAERGKSRAILATESWKGLFSTLGKLGYTKEDVRWVIEDCYRGEYNGISTASVGNVAFKELGVWGKLLKE